MGGTESVIDVDITQLSQRFSETSDFVLFDLNLRGLSHKEDITLFPCSSLKEPSSSAWNLRFSRRMISPFWGLAQASSMEAPTQSSRNLTFFPKSCSKIGTTGFKECLATFLPSGLPRWLQSTTLLAPGSSQKWDKGCTGLKNLLDCGERFGDSSVISDLSVDNGDVEVNSDEDSLVYG